MRYFRSTICAAFLTVFSSLAAGSAQAASCWSEAQQAAARVRDLQTKLMVSAMQCQSREPSVLAAYNRFVVAHRATISSHNTAIRAHFVTDEGKAGERSYDRFTTSLANVHGRTTSSLEDCQASASFIRAAAASPGSELALLAASIGIEPALPGGACPVRVAQRP